MRTLLLGAARWSARAAVVCVLAGVGLVTAGAPASAHGQLAMSKPVNGSTLSKPLDRLELYFTEQPASNAHFTVTAPSGVRVDAGWTSGQPQRLDKPVQEYFLVDGKFEPRVYNVGFPAMLAVAHWPEKGRYSATYLSVASDGEPVRGTVTFTYTGAVSGAAPGWTPPTDGPAETLVQAVEGGHAPPGTTPSAGPIPTANGDAPADTATRPTDDDNGLTGWILPGILVVAVATVVIIAARRPPAARPGRSKSAGRGGASTGGRGTKRGAKTGRGGPKTGPKGGSR